MRPPWKQLLGSMLVSCMTLGLSEIEEDFHTKFIPVAISTPFLKDTGARLLEERRKVVNSVGTMVHQPVQSAPTATVKHNQARSTVM